MRPAAHRLLTATAALSLGAVLLAGCGGDDAVEDRTVPEILDDAATAMHSLDTVRFELERTGAPAYIDDQGLLRFDSAIGRYAAPASADAVIEVSAAGLSTEVGAVSIDGEGWITNPISGDWEPLPDSFGFDPTSLFDPALGWNPLLNQDLAAAVLIDTGDRDGTRVHHIRGIASADRVEVVTAGLLRGQSVELDLWIEVETSRVVELSFESLLDGQIADWVMRFLDFDEPVTIEPPPLDG